MVMGAGWGAFAAYVPEIKAGLEAGDGLFGLLLLCSSFGLLTSMWLAPRLDECLHAKALPVAAGTLAVSFLLPGTVGTVPTFAVSQCWGWPRRLSCPARSRLISMKRPGPGFPEDWCFGEG